MVVELSIRIFFMIDLEKFLGVMKMDRFWILLSEELRVGLGEILVV